MTEGVMLGILAWLSAIFSWWHLPAFLKRFSIRWFVLTDILFTVITYLTVETISQSLTALISTIVAGLLMNITMMFFRWIPAAYDYATGDHK